MSDPDPVSVHLRRLLPLIAVAGLLAPATANAATRFTVAANLQYLTGQPWASSAQVSLPQGLTRILLETPGSRRLSSQTLLDLRVSHMFEFAGTAHIELLLDVLAGTINTRLREHPDRLDPQWVGRVVRLVLSGAGVRAKDSGTT